MDSLRHPDLVELSAKMKRALEAVLHAEQTAAQVARKRQRSLRDVVLEFEDRGQPVRVSTAGQRWPVGVIVGVGLDHLMLRLNTEPVLIAFHSIQSIEPA